jgi:hemolysin activation/secretion protein
MSKVGWLSLFLCALGVMVAPAGSAAAEGEISLSVSSFAVEGDNPLSDAETQALLQPYQGGQRGLAALESAADVLEQAIRERGYAFHRVILPPQTLGGDVVRLRVLRFHVGEIYVSGNQYFSRDNVLRSLPELKSGATPNVQSLARSLAIGNEHPSRRTALSMREGAEPDTIDAEVRVQDVDPQQIFAALSNTGRHDTGWYRATLGYQYSNLFDLDHTVTASYTTSPDHTAEVKQYGLNYWLPLYGVGGSLAAYYVYSDVDSGRVADFFQVSGKGEFYGVRYTQAFARRDNYNHKLALAVDNRYFTNNVSFSGAPIGTNVGSRPLSLRYSGNADHTWGSGGFYAEYAHNMSGGSGNDDAAYTATRFGAARNWKAMRYGADLNYDIGKSWSFTGRLRGQQTDQALIPGEQFGLGGIYSVRGFYEREISGDNGHFVNAELWMPQLAPDLRLLAFFDAGRVSYNVPVPGQPDALNIASIGAGLRWQWQRQLDLSADVGYVLDGIPGGSRPGETRLHFSLVFRF